MGVHLLEGGDAVRGLAAELNSTTRDRPYVVVSTPAQRSAPFIDAEEISNAVGDLARVYLIPTGAESWMFTRGMPDHTQVYGGAGRVYPVGTDWVLHPRASPLRFAFDEREGKESTQRLIADALRMAAEAGLLTRHDSKPIQVGGEIQGLVPPTRAMVRTTDRRIASIWQELLFPEVPIDRWLAVGMQVQGSLEPETGLYDVTAMLLSPEEGLAHYRAGDVVLAEVSGVDEERATLRLHPAVDVVVTREEVSSNELDLVSSLMTAGEVLAARVVETGPHWRLTLLDVDDDELPVRAPSLLRGGPPWLAARALERPEPAAAPDLLETAEPAAAPDLLETAESVAAPDLLEPAQVDEPAELEAHLAPPSPRVARSTPVPTPALLDPARRAGPAGLEAEVAALRRERDRVAGRLQRAEEEKAGLLRSLSDLRNERQLLHSRLERTKAEARRTADQLRKSKTDLRKARQKAERSSRSGRGTQAAFVDPEEQFRHEVYLAWAERIPAAEKLTRTLPSYSVGPDFLSSVAEIDGIDRSKIVDVVFEVVTGLADELVGRDMHQLRGSENGDAPALTRQDGATAWRVALQAGTPQARRLHFWRLHGGEIELSRVVLHDDFTP